MPSTKKRKHKKSTSPKTARSQSPETKKGRVTRSTRAKKIKKQRIVAPPPSAISTTFPRKLYLYVALLVIGIVMMTGGAFYYLYRQTILSFKVAPIYQVTAESRGSEPKHVKIESAQIDLPITPAHIVGGVWETSDTTATHLVTSARPGEKSNIVIYGHNRNYLFKNLHKVKTGDRVTLVSEDGTEYLYEIMSQTVVTPDQIEVVLPTQTEELTLYTCTGFLDSKRLVIKAAPISVNYTL